MQIPRGYHVIDVYYCKLSKYFDEFDKDLKDKYRIGSKCAFKTVNSMKKHVITKS